MTKAYIVTEAELADIVAQGIEAAFKRLNVRPAYDKADSMAPATKSEACQYLRISMPTLDALIKSGQIKAYNLGRAVRIPRDEIENFLSKTSGK